MHGAARSPWTRNVSWGDSGFRKLHVRISGPPDFGCGTAVTPSYCALLIMSNPQRGLKLVYHVVRKFNPGRWCQNNNKWWTFIAALNEVTFLMSITTLEFRTSPISLLETRKWRAYVAWPIPDSSEGAGTWTTQSGPGAVLWALYYCQNALHFVGVHCKWEQLLEMWFVEDLVILTLHQISFSVAMAFWVRWFRWQRLSWLKLWHRCTYFSSEDTVNINISSHHFYLCCMRN